MSGINAVGGFGAMDPSAFVGLNGLGGAGAASASSASAVATTSSASTVATLGINTNMQSLVQNIQEMGTTEVLLALLLAGRSEQKNSIGDDRSTNNLFAAFAMAGMASKMTQVNAQFEMSATAITAQAGTGMSVNLSA